MVKYLNRGGIVLAAPVFLVAAALVFAAKPAVGTPGGLAATGSPLGPVLLVIFGLLVVGGIVFLVLGRRAKAKQAAQEERGDSDSSAD